MIKLSWDLGGLLFEDDREGALLDEIELFFLFA